MTALLPIKRRSRAIRPSKLRSITVRGFGGGWNTIQDDISMTTRYMPGLTNFHRTASASQELRFGSDFFVDVSGVVSGNIVDMAYFNGKIISVTADGEVATTDSNGVNVAIWNNALANALPGTPTGWSGGLVSIDFVPFKNTIIIHNGGDKPISISEGFVTTYLQDLATGSNVNVPIGLYGCVVSNYHCIAGIPGSPTEIYIASIGTGGVFPGDPAPNDAISIDVGAYAPEGGAAIRGIAGFRSYLVVFFQSQSLLINLGVYNDSGEHTPQYPDTLPKFGLVGHRCILTVDNDLIFAGLGGISSAKRNLFSGLIDSEHLSAIIEPSYKDSIGVLTQTERLRNCFMVYDELNHDMLMFEPNGAVFVYTTNEKLKYHSWSSYGYSEPWTCGCTTALGRTYVAQGTKIFQLGNRAFGEQFYADRLNDRDADWAQSTHYTIGALIRDTDTEESYECTKEHDSAGSGTFAADRAAYEANWSLYEGEPITFELELPWLVGEDGMKLKQLRFVSVGSKGSASFNLSVYVDNLYKDVAGSLLYDPALSMEFVGNDARGYGYDEGGYGGGRRSGDPRLWSFPVKFKSAKFVISGSSRQPLQIISLSFLYAQGRYKR